MSIIPIISAQIMVRLLLRLGFVILRQAGSHIRLMHPLTKRATTVPLHRKDLTRAMMNTILKQAGVSMENFLKALGKQ